MKQCPQCRKTYDDCALLCAYDGSPLLAAMINPNALDDTIKTPTGMSEQDTAPADSQAATLTKPKAQKDYRARRRYLRERLGKFLEEGDSIRWGILSQQLEAHRKHGPWLKQVEQFLSEEPEFDYSHVARFKTEQLEAIKEFIKELFD